MSQKSYHRGGKSIYPGERKCEIVMHEKDKFPSEGKVCSCGRSSQQKGTKQPQDHCHQHQNRKKQENKVRGRYLTDMPLKLKDMILNLKVN